MSDPPRPSTWPRVTLPRTLEAALLRGHPWVYRDHVGGALDAPSGAVCELSCGRFRGFALWDAASPIALRIVSRRRAPDAALVRARVEQAWELRASVRAAGTTAYRWLNGEGDGLPGVVVDVYARFAVLVTYADAVEPLVPWVVDALERVAVERAGAPLAGISRRARGGVGESSLVGLRGRPPPARLVVEEHGVRMLAELAHGQKTGLFLDQRDNRRYLAGHAGGRSVLNLFGYTGGFAVHAAVAGASRVTSVDVAPEATEAARENLRLNGVDPDAHELVTADVFDYLTDAGRRAQRWDLVISDPPSFARRREGAKKAARAYERLAAACVGVTEAGGFLAAASCTSQVGPPAFRDAVAAGVARAGATFQIVHDAAHAADHPVACGHPEGRYLKLLFGRVLPRD
ncbi:MAG: class I SAM-dependent rRNA methyltransferase [Polyangiaceae bacterium]|nr:class I SAM-dependent rRNA methyltransferase [Polyangiaceae bacterium]